MATQNELNPTSSPSSMFGRIRRDDTTIANTHRSQILAQELINEAVKNPTKAMDLYLSSFVTVGSFEIPGHIYVEEDPRTVKLKMFNITEPKGLG